MRKLTYKECNRHGCQWCNDIIPASEYRGQYIPRECPYEKCPYTVLDKFKSYADYMKYTDGDSLVKALEAMG